MKFIDKKFDNPDHICYSKFNKGVITWHMASDLRDTNSVTNHISSSSYTEDGNRHHVLTVVNFNRDLTKIIDIIDSDDATIRSRIPPDIIKKIDQFQTKYPHLFGEGLIELKNADPVLAKMITDPVDQHIGNHETIVWRLATKYSATEPWKLASKERGPMGENTYLFGDGLPISFEGAIKSIKEYAQKKGLDPNNFGVVRANGLTDANNKKASAIHCNLIFAIAASLIVPDGYKTIPREINGIARILFFFQNDGRFFTTKGIFKFGGQAYYIWEYLLALVYALRQLKPINDAIDILNNAGATKTQMSKLTHQSDHMVQLLKETYPDLCDEIDEAKNYITVAHRVADYKKKWEWQSALQDHTLAIKPVRFKEAKVNCGDGWFMTIVDDSSWSGETNACDKMWRSDYAHWLNMRYHATDGIDIDDNPYLMMIVPIEPKKTYLKLSPRILGNRMDKLTWKKNWRIDMVDYATEDTLEISENDKIEPTLQQDILDEWDCLKLNLPYVHETIDDTLDTNVDTGDTNDDTDNNDPSSSSTDPLPKRNRID